MNNFVYFRFVGIALATVLVAGCESPGKVLGLARNKPDEFTVIKQAPLSLPPNYKDLPTPNANGANMDGSTAREKARSAVLPKSTIDKTNKSAGEVAFLKMAGVERRNPEIRKQVNTEARIENKQEESFVRDLINFKKNKKGKVINPREENKRITGKEMPGDA